MAGIKISALPTVPSAQLTDVFPVVQGGTTYKESNQQLLTLIQAQTGAVLLNPTGPQTITGQNLTLSGASFAITGSGNLTIASGNITNTLGDFVATNGNFLSPLGSFSSGSSAGGVVGAITMYSTTTNLGRTVFNVVNNGGNYTNLLTNASTSAARTWTLPDATGTIALTGSPTSGYVLLNPSADQTILNAHNLIMATGSMVAPTMLPGNLSLSGNTLSSTNSNGNINIDANGQGQYLIGSSTLISPQAANLNTLQFAENGSESVFLLTSFVNSSNTEAYFNFIKSRSTTVGGFSAVQVNDYLGSILIDGDDGTQYSAAAKISIQVSGAVSTGIVPSTIYFSTCNAIGGLRVGMALNDAQNLVLTNPLLPASGGTGVTSVTTAPTATAFAGWDANLNMSASNFFPGYTTTVTSGIAATLTIASTYYQFWTGSTSQIALLPHTGTVAGATGATQYYFVNNSSATVTVQASGGQVVQAMVAGSACLFTCISAAGTTAASWNAQYAINADLSGAVLLAPGHDQAITGNYIFSAYNITATNNLIGGTIEITGDTIQNNNANHPLILSPNGTSLVSVGTTTNFSPVPSGVTQYLFQIGLLNTDASMTLGSFTNATTASILNFTKSRNVTPGSFTTIQSGDTLGTISAFGDDGAANQPSANIAFVCGGAVSSGHVPGSIVFSTSSTVTNNVTAMTISDTQIVTLANALPVGSGGLGITTTPSIGFVPIGNGTNYTAAALTPGAGVSITNGSGTITIAATGGGLAVATIAGTSQAGAVNTKYFALNAGQTTLTLPATIAVGNIVALIGSTANTGGWIVTANTGQTIRVNNATTSSGGTVTSAAIAGQTIYLEADTTTSWVMSSTVSTTLTTA